MRERKKAKEQGGGRTTEMRNRDAKRRSGKFGYIWDGQKVGRGKVGKIVH